jgi:hypothetical protein
MVFESKWCQNEFGRWDDHNIYFCRRKYVGKNYRINPIMELLEFPYLNLNICKEIQLFWEEVLLDGVL